MRWLFKLIEKSDRFIIYAYSTESYDLDGKITYDIKTGESKVLIPSKRDESSIENQEMAIESFEIVVSENFPEERYVCIG